MRYILVSILIALAMLVSYMQTRAQTPVYLPIIANAGSMDHIPFEPDTPIPTAPPNILATEIAAIRLTLTALIPTPTKTPTVTSTATLTPTNTGTATTTPTPTATETPDLLATIRAILTIQAWPSATATATFVPTAPVIP